MKSILLCLYAFISLASQTSQGRLTILGTVHFPTPYVNTDSIYDIIEHIKPDVILLEADMNSFNADFSFKKTYDENEWNAVVAYKKKYPNTAFRPFEIEGRNHIRVDLGIEGHNPIFNTIYDLYDQKKLTSDQMDIWKRFVELADSLDNVGKKSLRILNDPITDNLVQERQFYQYHKVLEIVNNHSFFETMTITKKMKCHTGRSFFKTYSNFELKRNHTMAKNILNHLKHFKGKRVLVMTGFYHRFALIEALRFELEKVSFKRVEFYE